MHVNYWKLPPRSRKYTLNYTISSPSLSDYESLLWIIHTLNEVNSLGYMLLNKSVNIAHSGEPFSIVKSQHIVALAQITSSGNVSQTVETICLLIPLLSFQSLPLLPPSCVTTPSLCFQPTQVILS